MVRGQGSSGAECGYSNRHFCPIFPESLGAIRERELLLQLQIGCRPFRDLQQKDLGLWQSC